MKLNASLKDSSSWSDGLNVSVFILFCFPEVIYPANAATLNSIVSLFCNFLRVVKFGGSNESILCFVFDFCFVNGGHFAGHGLLHIDSIWQYVALYKTSSLAPDFYVQCIGLLNIVHYNERPL